MIAGHKDKVLVVGCANTYTLHIYVHACSNMYIKSHIQTYTRSIMTLTLAFAFTLTLLRTLTVTHTLAPLTHSLTLDHSHSLSHLSHYA